MEHFFTTYIRTKLLFHHRLNDLKDYTSVKIYVYELEKLGVNKGPLLYDLKQRGEISYNDKGYFKVMRDGPVDPNLLQITKKQEKLRLSLTPLHIWMRDQLFHVDLIVDKKEMPVYFKAFLDGRSTNIEWFFTVDGFAGRVHTPVVNLKQNLRSKLRFYGGQITSLDVKQMQPTILAKVLQGAIGDNPFTTAIYKGEDVYMLLLQSNKTITTRDQAKKLLFQLIFGKPMDDIGRMFRGDTEWVDWINSYKKRVEPLNPHKNHKHTNLAWLLQYSEVKVMTDIWEDLKSRNLPFLTIHDDILCRKGDALKVYSVMERILKTHFKKFHITVDHGL
jgi:hypothetical protein